jgi:hypothetical protein
MPFFIPLTTSLYSFCILLILPTFFAILPSPSLLLLTTPPPPPLTLTPPHPPDDDDEGAFSASQCLDTIGGVLDAVQERGDTMAQLEVLVMPLLQKYARVLT